MGKTPLVLAQVSRQILFAPVLLSVLVQLYRWWLKRRLQQKQCSVQPSVANPWQPARDLNGKVCPPPRPGFDSDDRIANIADDPRYFQGAEVGKAQRAALGQTGLAGQNTQSFDPSSTLVRPALRVLHGIAENENYGASFKPDDVILVPGFACLEDDHSFYETIVDDMRSLGLAGREDPRKLPLCAQMVDRICTYFGLVSQDCSISLTWHRDGQDPAVFQGKAASSAQFECAVSLCLGAPGELHYAGIGARSAMQLPCGNGHLVLVARDVDLDWHQPREPPSHNVCEGQILITVSGPSARFLEEDRLSPKVVPDTSGATVQVHGAAQRGSHRPPMRIMTVLPSLRYPKPVSHDDVIIVPDFFCAKDDWNVYYKLLEEMRDCQSRAENKSEWLSWHEGAHLLTKNPEGSRTYQAILERLREYFGIVNNGDQGTRYNWYRDGSDWKPFHHDSAAFNAQRAAAQNCTIGISFGASRELAFRHAKTGELVYFPQTNGMLFFFGRDANIRWQHAINALPVEDQHEKGRVSIILWGLCSKTFEEDGSPEMLAVGDRGGKGGAKGGGKGVGKGYEQTCRNFQQRGSCSYGDRCRFAHIPGGSSWK